MRKQAKYTMADDISKYPIFLYYPPTKEVIPADYIKETRVYNPQYQMHHFIRQTVRKNSPEFYARVEHLQKLILVPAQMNYDLETMGAERFYEKWQQNKDDMVFNRKKWREGYYEERTDKTRA